MPQPLVNIFDVVKWILINIIPYGKVFEIRKPGALFLWELKSPTFPPPKMLIFTYKLRLQCHALYNSLKLLNPFIAIILWDPIKWIYVYWILASPLRNNDCPDSYHATNRTTFQLMIEDRVKPPVARIINSVNSFHLRALSVFLTMCWGKLLIRVILLLYHHWL